VLLKLEGLDDKKATSFYAGKRVVYIYKAGKEKNGSSFRTMWGRIGNPHGANGLVRAKFAKNLPPRALGAPVRIMLYPSTI
jgi:large subunit ribosomal protein L35Ae